MKETYIRRTSFLTDPKNDDLQPAKLIPPRPLTNHFTLIAICSNVPRLSPVHIALKRREPAKNERTSKNLNKRSHRGIRSTTALC